LDEDLFWLGLRSAQDDGVFLTNTIVRSSTLEGMMNELDLILLFVILVGLSVGLRRGLIRVLISIVGIYIAVAVAGYVYDPMGRVLADAFGLGSVMTFNFSYLVVLIVMTVVVEIVSRVTFEDTRLPRLGRVDNLLGGIVGIGYGALWASLLLIPFQFSHEWQTAIRGSALLPNLNEFFWTAVLSPLSILFEFGGNCSYCIDGIPKLYHWGVPYRVAQLLMGVAML
jgi:uncharacterized membrane protein required for colicin V production